MAQSRLACKAKLLQLPQIVTQLHKPFLKEQPDCQNMDDDMVSESAIRTSLRRCLLDSFSVNHSPATEAEGTFPPLPRRGRRRWGTLKMRSVCCMFKHLLTIGFLQLQSVPNWSKERAIDSDANSATYCPPIPVRLDFLAESRMLLGHFLALPIAYWLVCFTTAACWFVHPSFARCI